MLKLTVLPDVLTRIRMWRSCRRALERNPEYLRQSSIRKRAVISTFGEKWKAVDLQVINRIRVLLSR